MNWLFDLNIWVQATVIASIITGILVITNLLLFFFKPEIKKKNLKYIYAFSSGFLIITAIVGQWASARHMIIEHHGEENYKIHESIIGALIFIGGAVLGYIIAFIIKRINTDKADKACCDQHSKVLSDSSTEIAKVKNKTSIVFMILAHRIPAGLILGVLLSQASTSSIILASLITFVVHIIPELTVIYYARVNAGYGKFRSLVFSIGSKMLLIPFMFIGVALNEWIGETTAGTYWIQPFLLAAVGLIMAWGAIFELGPQFIHMRNDSEKAIYKFIFLFFLGAILSMAIQFVHFH